MTTGTLTRTEIERQLHELRDRLPALALDNKTAELLDVERAIRDGELQLERLALAGIEQARRDAVAQRQAEVVAREETRLAAIAWEKQRLASYAAVTLASDALTAAIRLTLEQTGGLETRLWLGDFIAGEVTKAGLQLFGRVAPRRPLPTNEGATS